MDVVYSSRIASSAHHRCTPLPHSELKTHTIIGPRQPPYPGPQSVKYTTALETEHSRDLYLQGAMAIGQIARLLEELCADIYDADADVDDENGEDGAEDTVAVDELSTHWPQADTLVNHQFVSHEKRAQISAWARAVMPADDICINVGQAQSQCDGDIIDLEDANATYLRGAFIVGDIADLLESLVRGFDDEQDEAPEDYEKPNFAAFSSDRVALAQLAQPPVQPLDSDEIPDTDFASRLSCLSARLAKLEVDINAFSQDRSIALRQMELADESPAAAQDSDKEHWSGCDETVETVDRCRKYMECPDDTLDSCDIMEHQDSLLLSRVWTGMTDTTTSGFSLVTPPGSEVQPVNLDSQGKDYFWALD